MGGPTVTGTCKRAHIRGGGRRVTSCVEVAGGPGKVPGPERRIALSFPWGAVSMSLKILCAGCSSEERALVEAGVRAGLASDEVHPTEAGYRLMAPVAEKAIAEALRR